jgi:tetratricopeptide (TPR) repeat protein
MSARPARTTSNETIPGSVSRRGVVLAGAVIVLAVGAAYANSFSAPFVFDDLKSITQNPTIRHFTPWSDVLSPPNTATGAAGRPVVNLSLAVNYALGGLEVRGYHVFNTLVHALAALTLFGIVRRTLLRPVLRARFGGEALPLAFATALLWALHPLLTESVTCVVQRSESLMGLFYLLTLYGFIRAVESPAPRRWEIFAVVACLLGMATKEVMVSAPLVVLLYDRTFVSGSFGAAWAQRRKFYVCLAASWLLLAWLVAHVGHRGGGAGLGLGVSPWDYALTQCRAIVLYLRLAVWPRPLVVDYGTGIVRGLDEVWLQALLLLALLAATLVALKRRPVLGFVGGFFFAILAPSSSVVPLVSQTIAEHRMYLPLAAVIGLAVGGGYRWLGKLSLPVWLVLAAVAGFATVARNRDYRDALTLWGVTVADRPDNARAQMNFGTALSAAGRLEEAATHFAAAAQDAPGFADADYSLAGALLQLHRPADAQVAAERALQVKPDYAEAHYVLGTALLQQGQVEPALGEYETALRLHPDFADALHTLAGALAMVGRTDEALDQYAKALRLQPGNPLLHEEMGGVLARLNRVEEAAGHFEAAVRLDPGSVASRYNFGTALLALRRFAEAAEQYAGVVKLQPGFAAAHNNLGNALTELGRLDEAQVQYEETLRLEPDFAAAKDNLARLQALRAAGSRR